MPLGKIIRIDREVYQALQALAEPLKDTPNTVLRRVLGLDPGFSGKKIKLKKVVKGMN